MDRVHLVRRTIETRIRRWAQVVGAWLFIDTVVGEETGMWRVLAGDLFRSTTNLVYDSATTLADIAPRRKLAARVSPGFFFHLRFSGAVELVFDCHDWSGTIEVREGAGIRKIDLYSDEPVDRRVQIGKSDDTDDRFVEVIVLEKRNPLSKGNQAWISRFSFSNPAGLRWRDAVPVPVDTSSCTARFEPGGTVIQLHMPHCAGLSMAEAFSQMLPAQDTVWVTPDGRSKAEKESWLRTRAGSQAKPRYVYMHEVLTLPDELAGAEFFTLLRNPRDRFLSHYYFVKQMQETRGIDRYGSPSTTRSLTAFVAYIEATGLRREFSTIHWLCDFFGLSPTLRHAELILKKKVRLAGVSEYFEPCLFIASTMLGSEAVPRWMVRGASSRPPLEDLNPALLDRIDALLVEETTLFERTKRRFEDTHGAAIAYVKNSGLSFQRTR